MDKENNFKEISSTFHRKTCILSSFPGKKLYFAKFSLKKTPYFVKFSGKKSVYDKLSMSGRSVFKAIASCLGQTVNYIKYLRVSLRHYVCLPLSNCNADLWTRGVHGVRGQRPWKG